MSTLRIIGLLLSIWGTVVLGVWGFPVTRMAMRVSKIRKREKFLTWSGFCSLLVGFSLQLIAEICPLCC